MAALALPMMGQRMAANKVTDMRNRNEKVTFAPVKAFDATNCVVNRGDSYLWDFETDESFEGWSALDNDGDGYSWEIDDYNSYNGGSYCLTSRSYYSGTVLYPDNWLFSPMVTLQSELSIYAANYLSSYPDIIAIYVYVGSEEDMTVDKFVKVSADFAPANTWTEYKFDLSEYAGQEGCFAIRHYNSVDQYRVLVDYISLYTPLPPLAMPENLTAEPTMTTAAVAWDDAENANWNLRYRPYTEPTGAFWDFEEEEAADYAAPAGWTTIDADGDGYNWMHWNNQNAEWACHSGYGHMTSESYVNYVGELYPDNWLISPKTRLTGDLSFWAAGQDPSYAAEVFAVYVSTGDPTDINSFVKISDDITATGDVTEYAFDLAEYEGQDGYVAIRHYNVTDMYRLNIDDVLIGTPNEEAEWIYVNALDATNYTIEGLDPETTYEVQVQAYDENQETPWTESTIFTTLGDEPTDQCHAPNCAYEITGFETATVTITNNEPGATVYYEVYFNGELVEELCGSFEGDEFSFNVTGDGEYKVVAVAKKAGYKDSTEGGVWFWVMENETPVGISELVNGKQIAGVRYFNALGQEMQSVNGMTIVVTTYTDGTTSTAKVVK